MLSLWGPGQASRLLLATQRAGLVSKNSRLFPSPQWNWCGGAGLGAWTQALHRSPPRCLPSVLHAREESSLWCLASDLMYICSFLKTFFTGHPFLLVRPWENLIWCKSSCLLGWIFLSRDDKWFCRERAFPPLAPWGGALVRGWLVWDGRWDSQLTGSCCFFHLPLVFTNCLASDVALIVSPFSS